MKLLKTIVAVMAVIVTVSCTGSKKQSIMKREEAKKILVVVDLQRDFIDGTLPAADGASIIPSIEGIKNDFDMVYFTLDWHPWNHCPWDNGGIWPQHCVRYTIGAGLPDIFLTISIPPIHGFFQGSDQSKRNTDSFKNYSNRSGFL